MGTSPPPAAQLFEALFRNAGQPLLVVNSAGHIAAVNEAACKLLGQTEEALLAQRVWQLFAGLSQTEAEARWRSFLARDDAQAVFTLARADEAETAVLISLRRNLTSGFHLVAIESANPTADPLPPLYAGFEAFLEHLPAIAVLKDAQGRYIYINRLGMQYFSRVDAANAGKTTAGDGDRPQSETPSAQDEAILRGDAEVLTSEYTVNIDGETRLFRSQKFMVPLPGGATGVGTVSTDISAEQTLAESQQLNQSIAATVPFLLYVYDLRAQKHVFRNDNVTTFFGVDLLAADTKLVDLFVERIHPDDLPDLSGYQQQWETALDGAVLEWVARVRNAAGEYRWLHTYETVLSRDEAGLPLSLLGSAVDVTDQIRSRKEADEQRRRLDSVVQSAPVNLITIDTDGVITSLKGQTLAEMGFDPAQLIDRNATDFAPAGIDGKELLARILNEEAFHFTLPMGERHFDVRTSPLRDAAGVVTGAVIVSTDVTERVLAEQQLERKLGAERIIADITRRFIGLPRETIPDRVSEALETIGRLAKADCCYLATVDPQDGGQANLDHFWQRDPDFLSADAERGMEFSTQPWAQKQLRAGKSILLSSIDQLPAEAPGERQSLEQLGCRALLEVPIQWNGRFVGVMGMRMHQARRDWSAEEETLLQVTGQILFSVLQRYESERARELSDARFRAIFEETASGMVISSEDGRILQVNQTFCELVGRSPEQLLASKLSALTHPADRSVEAPQVADLVAGRVASYQLQKRYIHRDGYDVWVLVSVTAVRDQSGGLKYIIGHVQDIADFKQAEQALRESEHTYRTLTENMPDSVARFDQDSRMLFVTDKLRTALGLTKAQMLNKSPRELGLDGGPGLGNWEETIRAVFTTGVPSEEELSFEGRDGRTHHLLQRLVPERNADGEIVTVLGITSDITERRTRDEERRKLLLAIDQSPLGIVITDADFKIEYLSPAYAEISGYTIAEALGKTPALWRSNAHDDDFYATIDAQVMAKRRWQGTIRNRHKSGREYWEKVIIAPIVDGDGGLSGYVSFREDITAVLAQEDQLQQHERLAAVGQLAAGIAHDFNNIMAVITLFGQLTLLEETLSSKARERMQTVISQSQRAAELTQQILDFSRQSALERQTLDLLPLIKEMGKLLERTMPESIELRMQYENTPLRVLADPTRFQQIIMNLCVNARDAMNGEGLLTVGVHEAEITVGEDGVSPLLPPGRYARLSIADNGSGIPQDVLPHIFEPFYTTKEQGLGTGLGLAQVYGIVQQHDGHILVDSNEGIGSTFSVYLPLISESVAGEASGASDEVPRGQNELVLVVEDSSGTRAALIDALTALNYRVHAVENGVRALEAIATLAEVPAVIWSDVVMPQMGGVALLRELQVRELNIPVIMSSGYLPPDDLKALHDAGMTAWLPKPPHLRHVAQTLRQVLTA